MRDLAAGLFGRRTAPAPVEMDAREPELLELLIFTAAEAFRYQVPAPDSRITDWLNSGDQIRGRRLEADGPGGWTNLVRADCLVVVPPASAGDPKRRLHRPKQRMVVRLGPITVTGAAHAPAGTEASAFLGRHGQAFVALTGAAIDAPSGDQRAPVAIVHLALADSLSPATGGS